jgi:hypothetical protein
MLVAAGRRVGRPLVHGQALVRVCPARDHKPVPATIPVERLTRDGPFRGGDRYDLAAEEHDDRHIHGAIRDVRPTGPHHVMVTVEFEDGE